MKERTKLYLYAAMTWVVLVFIAILNAGVREGFFSPTFGDHIGHVVSSIMLSVLIFIVAYIFIRSIDIEYTALDPWLIGAMWLALTVTFEFLFGHYVMGHPWSRLLADYNIMEGKIWVLVLISTFISPPLADILN